MSIQGLNTNAISRLKPALSVLESLERDKQKVQADLESTEEQKTGYLDSVKTLNYRLVKLNDRLKEIDAAIAAVSDAAKSKTSTLE